MYRMGIDLGGTKIEAIILDDNGKETARKRIPTEQENGYDHILNNIKRIHDDMVEDIYSKQLASRNSLLGHLNIRLTWLNRTTGMDVR